MIRTMSAWFLHRATWKMVLLLWVATTLGYTAIVTFLSPMIVAATGGLEPFDTTWPLSAEEIAAGLPAYGPEAVSAYLIFVLADIPYLIIAGSWFVLTLAWLIRCSGYPKLKALADRGWLFVGYIPAMFDLIENAALTALVRTQPTGVTPLVEVAAFAHAVKFQGINVAWVTLFIMVIVAVWGWLSRRKESPQSSD